MGMVSVEDDVAEKLRPVEIRGRCFDRGPAEIVGLGRGFGTFVEITAHGHRLAVIFYP